ncbi:unnamed protein product (macronuclear) [Paramecium tetraurelia]|uniref:Small ribosomal subunit protein mS29 n=1 Tax=Paramecium tetraurelia TaxID=5888 RepID=A0CUP1_PARTE|nr:uncharacterized protein GSPATT00010708001 [Paramecium tetraurelia]CAK74508.1 unnamed protein product [Paramecium tetraurelia]|eukprot:XP_001441905.1 hypothetical protein (macronuclear) [Paramecium tetraurelia strain d4-2]
MKLAASEAFKKLKLKHYQQAKITTTKFYQTKPFFSMPEQIEKESGVLAPKRVNQVDLFKRYTYEVLPALEQSVELDLLDKVFQKVDPVVRESITQAYIRKQVEQLAQQPDPASIKDLDDNTKSNMPREKAKLFLKDWLDLNPIQIGKWIPLNYELFKKTFKFLSPGDFQKNLIELSKNFSLMMTDVGFKTIDYVDSSIRVPQIFQYKKLSKDNFHKEGFFIIMFNVLKGDFNDELRKHRNNELFQRVFATSVNFDALLTVILNHWELIQQLRTPDQRKEFFKSLVDQLLEKIDKQQANASMPELLFSTVKTLQFQDFTLDLTKYANNPLPVPKSLIENRFGEQYYGYSSNLLFYGDHGAGKSGVLMQAIIFAQQTGWIVAVVPSGYNWTSLKYEAKRHFKTGLYMQPKAAQEWLEQFKEANQEHLKTFQVDLSLYGKFNLSGVHDDDPDPCPNLYDERRGYHFKDFEKFTTQEERDFEEAQDQIMSARITLKIPKPQYLQEIIDYGISNAHYATNAVYEVMEQLYNTEKYKVLVAVDGINWFYRPSQIPSFRYESDKDLRGHVPPYHMSLPRLFMHFDGHKIKNGTKITASSIFKLFQHDFQPKHVLLPQKYGIKLNGAPLDMFRSFCEYGIQTGMWKCDEFSQNTLEQFWMETQGNYFETIKCMKVHWRDI